MVVGASPSPHLHWLESPERNQIPRGGLQIHPTRGGPLHDGGGHQPAARTDQSVFQCFTGAGPLLHRVLLPVVSTCHWPLMHTQCSTLGTHLSSPHRYTLLLGFYLSEDSDDRFSVFWFYFPFGLIGCCAFTCMLCLSCCLDGLVDEEGIEVVDGDDEDPENPKDPEVISPLVRVHINTLVSITCACLDPCVT